MIDKIGFEKLYKIYGAEMYNVCLRYCGDQYLSADIIHDIFLSLWERRNSLTIDDPKKYLIKSVKFRLLEHARNSERRRQLLHHISAAVYSNEHNPENNIIAKELILEFDRQTQALPKKQTEAFLLQQQKNYTNEQIAAELRIDLRTADNYISATSTKLKNFLKTSMKFFF